MEKVPEYEFDDVLKFENIVPEDKFVEATNFVLSKMSNSVSKTLGPGGGYTLICKSDATIPVIPTKDGFTVVQEYKFNDQVKHFISEIIKDISKRMNSIVGDSTTTGIIIAESLYNEIISYDILKKYPEIGSILPPTSIRSLLEYIEEAILEIILDEKNGYIVKKSLDRESENKYIENVARISSNNDSIIGNKVAHLYTKRTSDHVFIVSEVGTGDEDIINEEVGFEFGSGFISPNMANQPDRITCKLLNPKFLLIDGVISNADMNTLHNIIDYVTKDLNRPIVIIAKDYVQDVINMLNVRCTRGPIKGPGGQMVIHEKEMIAALRVNTDHDKSKDRLEDLRIILGAELVPTKKGKIINFKNNVDYYNNILGGAAEFSGTQLSTRIKAGEGDTESIKERIIQLEERIKEIELNEGVLSFSNVEFVKKRIAMLNSDMTMIKVGGASDKERRARKLIYDDAIMACKSAVSHGFTLGGNVSIPHVIENYFSELISRINDKINSSGKIIIVGNDDKYVKNIISDFLNIVKKSFKSAYKTVVNNMAGVNTDGSKNILDVVYDPNNVKPTVFNLVTGQYNYLADDADLVVPGNTDIELMSSIFGAIGILVSTNQMISLLPGEATIYRGGPSK